jgi:hypothetical protein
MQKQGQTTFFAYQEIATENVVCPCFWGLI